MDLDVSKIVFMTIEPVPYLSISWKVIPDSGCSTSINLCTYATNAGPTFMLMFSIVISLLRGEVQILQLGQT